MAVQIKQTFTVGGKSFDTRKEAADFIRLPKVTAALMKLTSDNKELSDWLIENQEQVEIAFESGTISRVTKSDKKKIEKAFEALAEIKDNPKLAFLQENAEAFATSFRWPHVKRMTDEEKETLARNTLMAASDNNEKLVEYIITNKDGVLEAYAAGVEKREISPQALSGLAAYREKQAAEKAAKEAAEAAK